MQYILSSDNVALTDADRALLDKKLNRLQKHLSPPYVTDIRLEHDTHHQTGKVIRCRITIEQGKSVMHAKRTAATVQDALDQTIEALEQVLKKHRAKTIAAAREVRRLTSDPDEIA